MKIVLIRHGESEANVAHIISDDPKRIVNLTARGKAQAAAAATQLRTLPFTHAYASEFSRARQTAEILLRHHSLELHIDARLNERISGMDGQPVGAFNDLVRADPLHIRPTRGESFVEWNSMGSDSIDIYWNSMGSDSIDIYWNSMGSDSIDIY